MLFADHSGPASRRRLALLLCFFFAILRPAPGLGNASSELLSTSRLDPGLTAKLGTSATPVKVWVFFSDKGGHELSDRAELLQAVEGVLHPRALERRARRRPGGELVDRRDLPVCASYIDAVLATGARRGLTSRWLNAISVRVSDEQAAAIASLPFVRSIEPVARGRLESNPLTPTRDPREGQNGIGSGDFYGASEEQLTQINLSSLHARGATGQGVVVGILDTGFRRSHAAFNDPAHPLQVVAEYDFVNGDPNTAPEPGDPVNQHDHGTTVLGILGAYKPGELVGAAYDASFALAKVEDVEAEYGAEEDWFVAGLEFLEAEGADVATSSLVAYWYTPDQLDGVTSIMAQGMNVAAENGLHCCQGAGNSGHDFIPTTSHLVTPADAFKTISTGAVNWGGEIAYFSSDGPTADGRLKPEILARGVATWSVSPSSDTEYESGNGTSFSTPLVAGAVGCLIGARQDLSVDEMRSALFQTASDFVINGEPDPLYIRGYGILDAVAALVVSGGATRAPAVGPWDLTLTVSPNPARTGMRFRFFVPRPGPGNLSVHDVAGRTVALLVDRFERTGWQSLQWDGRREDGGALARGLYLARLATPQGQVAQRILWLRESGGP